MALIFLHGRGLTRQVLDSVYEESNYFTTSDPVDVCKNHLHYEVIRLFLEWSYQISRFTISTSLFTYAKRLEDDCYWIHTVSGGFDDQDGHEKCTRLRLFLDIFTFHRLVTEPLLHSLLWIHWSINWTQANRPIQRRCKWGRCRCHPSLSLGPLRLLLSRRTAATLAREYEYICLSTTARTGTVVEPSCYFGRNEAVDSADTPITTLSSLAMLPMMRWWMSSLGDSCARSSKD